MARERARPHGGAVHAAAGPPPPEPHRIRERHPRPARPRHRSRRSSCRPTTRRAASTTSPARWASRRRWSRRTCRRRRRSAAWRSASPSDADAGRVPDAARTRRRTTTSRGCRSARAAACSSSTCSRPTASTRSRSRRSSATTCRRPGFGSVPCEQLEVLLDGERLQLFDWQGGGRQRPPPMCRGRGRRRPRTAGPEARLRRPRRRADARPLQDHGRAAHGRRRRSSQTNFAPVLDLDQHFMRDDDPDRADAGLHVLPARRARSGSKGRSTPTPAKDSPSRRKIFVVPAGRAPAEETAVRAAIVTNLATRAFRRPATAADVEPLMEFYAGRAARTGTSTQGIEMALARLLASPQFIYRIEDGAGATVERPGQAVSHQRPRPGVAAVVLPVEQRSRTTSC